VSFSTPVNHFTTNSHRGLAKAIKQCQKLTDATEAKEKKRILENKEGFARIVDHISGYRDQNPTPFKDSLDESGNTLDVNAREG